MKRMRVDSEGHARSMSRPPRDEMGIKDSAVSISKYCKVPCLFPTSVQKIANCCHKVFLTSFLLIQNSHTWKWEPRKSCYLGYIPAFLFILFYLFIYFFFLWQCAHVWHTHTSCSFTEGSDIPIMIYMFSRNQFTCHGIQTNSKKHLFLWFFFMVTSVHLVTECQIVRANY